MIFWDYSHSQYNAFLTKSTLSVEIVLISSPNAVYLNYFSVPLQPKGCEFSLKYVFIMARPIKETPVLKGKDVERFKYNLEHPTPVSAEEVTKARETYEKFKRITTFVL
jgi:hypothetical protein